MLIYLYHIRNVIPYFKKLKILWEIPGGISSKEHSYNVRGTHVHACMCMNISTRINAREYIHTYIHT